MSVVTEVARRPDMDPTRIALEGYSLGGFIALATAQQALQDEYVPEVRAVVVNWGAQLETTTCRPGFPPTLPIHGEKDEVVPGESASRSAETIRSVGSEATVYVVPGAPQVARSAESERLTLQFLGERLSTPSVSRPKERPFLIGVAGQ